MTDARMAAFAALDRSQQKQAIARLAALGWTDLGIAHATQLAVEVVRGVLSEPQVTEQINAPRGAFDGQTPTPLCPVFGNLNSRAHLRESIYGDEL